MLVSVCHNQLIKDLFCPEARRGIRFWSLLTMRNSVPLLISILLGRDNGLVGLKSPLQERWVQYLIAIAKLCEDTVRLGEILLRHVGRRFLISDVHLRQIGVKGLRLGHGIVGEAHRRCIGAHFYRHGLLCDDALEILPFIRDITFQLR